MHTLKKLLSAALIMALAMPLMAQDQTLEEKLQDMISNNAESYLSPFATAFGTSMNSGTFRKASPHKIFGIDATVNFIFTTVPESALSYDFYFPESIDFPINILGQEYIIPMATDDLYPIDMRETPTFFGDEDGATITPDADYAFNNARSTLVGLGVAGSNVDAIESDIRDLVNSNMTIQTVGGLGFATLPNVIPQVALGLPFGTEVMLRGFTIPLGDSGEELKMAGFGAKFYLNKVLPTIPLVFPAMSIGYYQTSLDLAGIITSQNTLINFQASKSIPFITVYGGVGIESSTISVVVDDDNGNNILDFDIDGDNSFRTTVGFRLKLALLSINADINTGEYSALNVGIGLTFR